MDFQIMYKESEFEFMVELILHNSKVINCEVVRWSLCVELICKLKSSIVYLLNTSV